MFSPADFNRPTPPPPSSLFDNRLLGAALLIIGIVLIVLMAVTYDQQIFIPFNATYAITQTYQARQTSTRPPRQPRNQTPQPRRRNGDLQSVSYELPPPAPAQDSH
ncbi:MAG: hypothetical protein KF716_32810 [Anaerolineae bacterium]|nr:hypothetical protein [Anaerolineae bacterium]